MEEEREGGAILKSNRSFFDLPETEIARIGDRLYLNLRKLLHQLASKLNAKCGLITYSDGLSQQLIYVGDFTPDLVLQENDKRLLMMGKSLRKDGIYIHPIMEETSFYGFICLWNDHQKPQPLSEHLVQAYTFLAAQKIEIQHKHDNLQHYAESLIQKKEELEKIQEYNHNLLSITTHDLSSPLNAVSGYLDMVDHHLNDEVNNQKLHGYYKRIQSGVNDVSDMLKQLSEVIKHKKGSLKLHKVKVNINWLIEDTCQVLKANAARKAIDLQISVADDPIYAEVDMVKFKRVIYNLVSNAIKYTRRQRHIFVKVQSDGKNVEVCVEDEGIGISQNELGTIFKPFVKLDRSDKRNDGISKGLGLYIASYFVELMDGEIHVESRAGKGSLFTVTMPLVTPEKK